MRLAVSENQQSEPLTPNEEILACERLSILKCKQERIAYMLASNITWVSQTLAFRQQLPPDCFEALMEGRMKRNVAVRFFAYDFDKRQKLFENTVLAEEGETACRIKEHREEQVRLEDESEMLKSDAEAADNKGDDKESRRLTRKSGSKERQAKSHADKASRAEKESGQIKQSHVSKGAANAGISTRKAKMLPKDEIEKIYVTNLEFLGDGETEDPNCGEIIPGEVVALVRATAQAILAGNRDPLLLIRTHMIEYGGWEIADNGFAPDDDDEQHKPSTEDIEDADDEFGSLEERDLDAELIAMSYDED